MSYRKPVLERSRKLRQIHCSIPFRASYRRFTLALKTRCGPACCGYSPNAATNRQPPCGEQLRYLCEPLRSSEDFWERFGYPQMDVVVTHCGLSDWSWDTLVWKFEKKLVADCINKPADPSNRPRVLKIISGLLQ